MAHATMDASVASPVYKPCARGGVQAEEAAASLGDTGACACATARRCRAGPARSPAAVHRGTRGRWGSRSRGPHRLRRQTRCTAGYSWHSPPAPA
eukprot:scaffold15352_cov107-Isochrysis_galbana.AAC.2